MKRANIKILALILSLIVLPPLMWELKSQVGVVPGGSGGVPDNAVQGASNLTTAGAIPYVSSTPGVLTQDSSLLWNGTYMLFPQNKGFGWTTSDRWTANTGGGGNMTLTVAGTTLLRVDRDALSVGIGKSNTSPTGTLHVYDATATTGVTTLTVRAGAGQSTTNQFTLQTSAGLDFLRVRTNGVFGPVLETVTSGGLVPFSLGNESLQVASNWIMQWNNVGAAYNTPDLGLARDAAGRLKITDGSTGLGQIMIASSTPASAAATCSAGTFTWDASFFYICTATNTWRRVAHATW